MRLFLILSPFAALSALLSLTTPVTAAFVAGAIAAVLVVADLVRRRSLKLLQTATLILLIAIGLYGLRIDPQVTSNAARLALDFGLLVVVASALAIGFPFTQQYARETVDAATAARPEFHQANRILTGVWIVAFAVMLVADIGAIYIAWLPVWTGLAAAFAARNGAAWFTQWYAARRRRLSEEALRLLPGARELR